MSIIQRYLSIFNYLEGYQFCGPGTDLKTRLARQDKGINPLDEACKLHDIAYNLNKDLTNRHIADKILQQSAWGRVKSKDASFGERAAALGVSATMKVKRKMGMGLKSNSKSTNRKNKVALGSIARECRKAIKPLHNTRIKTSEKSLLKLGAQSALYAARAAISKAGGRSKIRTPRIIPIPKSGGFLPILPILAAISAIGSVSAGAAGVAKTIHTIADARKKLVEAERHNKTMEAIAIGKKGGGMFLKQYRKGLGLYLRQHTKN